MAHWGDFRLSGWSTWLREPPRGHIKSGAINFHTPRISTTTANSSELIAQPPPFRSNYNLTWTIDYELRDSGLKSGVPPFGIIWGGHAPAHAHQQLVKYFGL